MRGRARMPHLLLACFFRQLLNLVDGASVGAFVMFVWCWCCCAMDHPCLVFFDGMDISAGTIHPLLGWNYSATK